MGGKCSLYSQFNPQPQNFVLMNFLSCLENLIPLGVMNLITVNCLSPQKGEKHQRKQFRQQVCLQFKTCLQSYYKAKKFRTDVSFTRSVINSEP